jgi:LacI family transcriptional regulator
LPSHQKQLSLPAICAMITTLSLDQGIFMVVTLKTVAGRAGVSVATVSHVLGSRAHLFSADTRARVLKASAQLGYRPSSCARAMRRRRFGAVAMLVADYAHLPYHMLNAFEQVMASEGIHVSSVWIPPHPEGAAPQPVPRILSERMVDGFLVAWDALPAVEGLVQQNTVPAICTNDRRPCDSVYCDEAAGTRLATEHLLKLGHRRIAYADYSASSHYSSLDRQEGYLQAMLAAGLPHLAMRQTLIHAERRVHVRQWLSAPDRPTAVVTGSTSTALPILLAATTAGLRIPEDLSLVTVEKQPYTATGLTLATVVEPDRAVGEAAARMLLEKIADGRRRLPARTFPGRFEPGETCVPPRGKA